MIPFRGRISIRQYMKDKPVKWGVKAFILADSHNGYAYCAYISVIFNLRNDMEVLKAAREIEMHQLSNLYMRRYILMADFVDC